MAADFFFHDPTFEIQPLKAVAAFKWQHLKNPEVQYAIAAEEQYLCFHLYMLKNLRHTRAGEISNPPYKYELSFSVRAGAVKAAVLIAASILEAALRALAEARNYPLNADQKRRTFGNVIHAWQENGLPRRDVEVIWNEITSIHEVRNFVHLHKAAKTEEAAWEQVLNSENTILQNVLKAIEHVSAIEA
jgi:hypothetical protein